MIEASWKRIAGIHVPDEGTLSAVWLAHETDADVIHVYDACTFEADVMAVIAEGLNCRGRWVPIAWEKSAEKIIEKLLDRGCNTLPEGPKETQAIAEVRSREIQERMRTGRFRVEKRLKNWIDEAGQFYRQDAQVPLKSFPLMAATRHAMEQIDYARRQQTRRKRQTNYPKIAMI